MPFGTPIDTNLNTVKSYLITGKDVGWSPKYKVSENWKALYVCQIFKKKIYSGNIHAI